MSKICILIAALACVARSQEPAVATASETCTATVRGTQTTLQPGDRFCKDENTPSVCGYGELYDQPCPSGFKCFELDNCPNGPEGTKCDRPPKPHLVQCYQYNKAPPYPTGPQPGAESRRRRQSDTVSAPAAPATETCTATVRGSQTTLQPGDRFCKDENTPSVCGYGELYDQPCPSGFKCFELDNCPNGPEGTTCDKPPKSHLVQCYQYNKAPPYPTGPPAGEGRRRRQADAPAAAAAPATETCAATVNGVQTTLQPGDRFCKDDNTPSVCGYGELYDQPCPAGFKCFELDNCPNGPEGTKCDKPPKSHLVQCYQLNRAPASPTGPTGGQEEAQKA